MIALGIDVGSVSIEAAILATDPHIAAIRDAASRLEGSTVLLDADGQLVVLSPYRRVLGDPQAATRSLMNELEALIHLASVDRIVLTGSGAYGLAKTFELPITNEFSAAAQAVGRLYPSVRTVFEMGGEDSRLIRLDRDPESGRVGIADYEKNGDCAAGTGSFIDQQASRLRYGIEDVGPTVLTAGKAPTIAGRCSVFAKSDMIHAQQKGYGPAEILKGLCEAVARNFKGAITRGKEIVPPVAFIGGVASNAGVVDAMREVFDLSDGELIVPEAQAWAGAIGAAFIAAEDDEQNITDGLQRFMLERQTRKGRLPSMTRLSTDRVVNLRDRIVPYSFDGRELPIPVHMGVDIGSVSTNLVLIDDAGDVVHEVYTYTQSRPIQVVNDALREMHEALGDRIAVQSVGTTGSGRELIGLLIGADTINDEITAHKTGATFVGTRLIDTPPDTIFEIGGQDSKYISLHDGIVVDFTMNEACAAGTGSFLEEQAEKLGVKIKNEFAERALRTPLPLQMGERCTVFMEKDVTSFAHQGADTDQICAGLAYSVVLNYLNRVVRGRPVGDHVFFQGGTAYNDAVAAAFSEVLDTQIIIPPHNGVVGAIGMALLARDAVARKGSGTGFRGWSLDSVDYELREFSCKGCTNACDIQQFTVEGEKTYWGDKCSDRYRKRVKTDRTAVIPNLLDTRSKALLGDYREPEPSGRPRVGIPRSLYFYDWFPFWRTYFEGVGADVVLSGTSSKSVINHGIEAVLSEPCFPIKVAHGHLHDLLQKQVDFVWQPNMVDSETEFPEVKSFLCPWGQTLPWVARVSPRLAEADGKWMHPTLHPREGIETIEREMRPIAAMLGASRSQHRAAIEAGYAALAEFGSSLQEAGQSALEALRVSGEPGVVLLGRPYNLYDPAVNLNVPTKLRNEYGINVVPMEFLPIYGIDISDVNDNMYWNYGRKILQAARYVSSQPHLRLMYITNFKCGPDSYIKTFAREAAQEPFLTLQFDGHANDAGTMTRCEAYLDSQGFFRNASTGAEEAA